jgi:Laminin B (Domain IV)
MSCFLGSWTQFRRGCSLIPLVLGWAGAVALLRADVRSDFELSDEGWRVIELADTFGAGPYVNIVRGPYRPAYLPEGGNPGGALLQVDTPGNSFFFSAPLAFRGNQSAGYGGFLRYDLAVALPPTGDWYVEADVILTGTNGKVLTAQTMTRAPGGWATYGLPLLESAWHKDRLNGANPTRSEFLAVLGGIRSLWIRGEQFYGTDTTYLDNVRLEAPAPLRLDLALADSLRLSAPVIPGLYYVLETSSDLAQWQSVVDFAAEGPT